MCVPACTGPESITFHVSELPLPLPLLHDRHAPVPALDEARCKPFEQRATTMIRD